MLPQKYVIEGQSIKTGKWIELYCVSPQKITIYEPQSLLWWKWVVPHETYENITEEQDDKLREEVLNVATRYCGTEIMNDYSSIRIINYSWYNWFDCEFWHDDGTVWKDGKWT